MWIKLNSIGIKEVKGMKRGVLLDNMGYQRVNRAVMLLKECTVNFYYTVYAVLSQMWLWRNLCSYGEIFVLKNSYSVNIFLVSLSAFIHN